MQSDRLGKLVKGLQTALLARLLEMQILENDCFQSFQEFQEWDFTENYPTSFQMEFYANRSSTGEHTIGYNRV